MKVSVKDFAVTMKLKNKGIELGVYNNNDKHLGDLVVTKTQLKWCRGKKPRRRGISIKWEDFIKYMKSRE
jgi:hypothetical protein